MSEVVEQQTKKAIAIIAEYIQRASKNEQLQEAKTRLDKKVVLFSDDENCDLGKLMSAMSSPTQPQTPGVRPNHSSGLETMKSSRDRQAAGMVELVLAVSLTV